MSIQADQYLGCLLGGAAGDALGYPVEFNTESEIFSIYGEKGITAFEMPYGSAIVSDDTQMTAFTANSVLISAVCGGTPPKAGARFRTDLAALYQEWYLTQTGGRPGDGFRAWIMREPVLFARRAPGNTCMSAIAAGAKGTIGSPVNHSKGCGGVMRAAPVGLLFDTHLIAPETLAVLGAESGAITHGHPLGWLPAAVLACAVDRLVHFGDSMTAALHAAIAAVEGAFSAQEFPDVKVLSALLQRAEQLAQSDTPVLDAVHSLGEGWVGEEALAIAVFCALRFEDDFAGGLIAAVNHRGDSDSTGAVAGNLLGARLGLGGIPAQFREGTDVHDILVTLAEDLAQAAQGSLDAPQLEKYRVYPLKQG